MNLASWVLVPNLECQILTLPWSIILYQQNFTPVLCPISVGEQNITLMA